MNHMNNHLIIDCFPYNGESIVEDRLKRMAHMVDLIYVTESWTSFSGKRKDQLHFHQNKEIFSPYMHKIRFLTIDEFPPMPDDWAERKRQLNPWMVDLNSWWREAYQRNYATAHIGRDCVNCRYIVIVADVDEIVAPHILRSLSDRFDESYKLIGTAPIFLEMDFYYYSWNWIKPYKWYNAFMVTDAGIHSNDKLTLNDMRIETKKEGFLTKAGWHLSYFMTVDELRRKIEHFSHKEFDRPEFKSRDWIERCIREGLDLFGRANENLVAVKERIEDR